MQFKMTVSDAVAKADALKKEIEILDLLIDFALYHSIKELKEEMKKYSQTVPLINDFLAFSEFPDNSHAYVDIFYNRRAVAKGIYMFIINDLLDE